MEFIWSLNFSLARRDQHTKTLWKYPSHPLFDSANRRGVACIFITPERSASNEPHEYVFCAKQIECAARCLHTRCIQPVLYVCMQLRSVRSVHAGTRLAGSPANLGTSRSQAWLRAVNTCIRIVCTPSVC